MQAKAENSPAAQATRVKETGERTRDRQFRAGIDGPGILPNDERAGAMAATLTAAHAAATECCAMGETHAARRRAYLNQAVKLSRGRALVRGALHRRRGNAQQTVTEHVGHATGEPARRIATAARAKSEEQPHAKQTAQAASPGRGMANVKSEEQPHAKQTAQEAGPGRGMANVKSEEQPHAKQTAQAASLGRGMANVKSEEQPSRVPTLTRSPRISHRTN